MGLHEDSSMRIGGLWTSDADIIFSGGQKNVNPLTGNSLEILNISFDTQKGERLEKYSLMIIDSWILNFLGVGDAKPSKLRQPNEV